MTALGERLRRLIAAAGPIPVSEYMARCLFDPEHGYYTTREPFGAKGDFTTAPEISQMFGEIIGVWIVECWRALGSPAAPSIAEIGPGRGTLAADVARTLRKIAPELADAALFNLVETSPRLRDVQRRTLASSGLDFVWHDTVETLPRDRALIMVGNELFDALPMRQFVKTDAGWQERMVGLAEDGNLHFEAGAAGIEAALLPAGATAATSGAIFETSPARAALMSEIAALIANQGGAGLFLDYGYARTAIGDTFQALRRHEPQSPLERPGEADLTSHVDFEALAAAAESEGLQTVLMTQGDFLIAMGLLDRAGRLGAERGRELQERLSVEVERLAAPSQMGTLFKAMLVAVQGARIAPFTAPD